MNRREYRDWIRALERKRNSHVELSSYELDALAWETLEREKRNAAATRRRRAKKEAERVERERKKRQFEEACYPGLRERLLADSIAIRAMRGQSKPDEDPIAALHVARASRADLTAIRVSGANHD